MFPILLAVGYNERCENCGSECTMYIEERVMCERKCTGASEYNKRWLCDIVTVMLDNMREERGKKAKVVKQRSSRMAKKGFFKRWVPSQLGRSHYLQPCRFYGNTNTQEKCQMKERIGSTSK